eukprot:1526526-Amphidinium_carterae.1
MKSLRQRPEFAKGNGRSMLQFSLVVPAPIEKFSKGGNNAALSSGECFPQDLRFYLECYSHQRLD